MESNFNQKHSEEQETQATTHSEQGREFATVEEAIRADIDQTTPPVEIAERLNQSLANEPKRGTSFWTRLGFKK
jgi:hypothetical protein